MTDKTDHDKIAAEKAVAVDKVKAIDNRDQDPRHPANVTPPSTQPMVGTTGSLPPEAYMTEQEKDAANSAKQPYPTGDPPLPSEVTIRGQGIKGGPDQPDRPDQPAAKPGVASRKEKD